MPEKLTNAANAATGTTIVAASATGAGTFLGWINEHGVLLSLIIGFTGLVSATVFNIMRERREIRKERQLNEEKKQEIIEEYKKSVVKDLKAAGLKEAARTVATKKKVA